MLKLKNRNPLVYFASMLLITSLTATTGCPGCSPCEERPYDHVDYINDTLKQFNYFKEGGRWVYQDSISKEYDTVRVLYSNLTRFESDHEAGCELDLYDRFDASYSSSYYSDTFKIDNQSNILIETRRFKRVNSDYTDYSSEYIFHSFPKDTLKGALWNIKTYRKLVNNYKLGEKTFDSVYVFLLEGPSLYNYQVEKTFFVKGIGIIRKEIDRGPFDEVWNLVDFNIQLKDSIYFKSNVR